MTVKTYEDQLSCMKGLRGDGDAADLTGQESGRRQGGAILPRDTARCRMSPCGGRWGQQLSKGMQTGMLGQCGGPGWGSGFPKEQREPGMECEGPMSHPQGFPLSLLHAWSPRLTPSRALSWPGLLKAMSFLQGPKPPHTAHQTRLGGPCPSQPLVLTQALGGCFMGLHGTFPMGGWAHVFLLCCLSPTLPTTHHLL